MRRFLRLSLLSIPHPLTQLLPYPSVPHKLSWLLSPRPRTPTDLSEKLRAAVNNNDIDGCFSLLRRGADPNLGDSKGRMPLHFATTKNNPQLLQVLLQHGADPNMRDANGNTPLHLAACTSNTKMITLLLNAGCDPNARDGEGGRMEATVDESGVLMR